MRRASRWKRRKRGERQRSDYRTWRNFTAAAMGSALIDVIQRLGKQLAVEREGDLQTLIGAGVLCA